MQYVFPWEYYTFFVRKVLWGCDAQEVHKRVMIISTRIRLYMEGNIYGYTLLKKRGVKIKFTAFKMVLSELHKSKKNRVGALCVSGSIYR